METASNIGVGGIAVLLAAFAVAVSVLKPGKNAQAIRAVGVMGIFSGWFWLSVTAAIWAVLDFVLPNKDKILAQIEKHQAGLKKNK
ncbi:MAG: hypothetical protein LBH81_02480 [Rickettsiales bacterium]|jgi:hypothetical protein|nr:hypothetical protein [Rickettsiales bacterium]